ncbi:MAG: hypothetical protein COA78_11475 [Blastopirellula sp.]|nr:MAG: hypothetical protein COA78_11475 [Blastopirellula sp.]
MFCIRNCKIASLIVLFTLFASLAHAQSDAEIALDKARTAYVNEQFEQARDLLITAVQTAGNNPDIHLLLGKSYYQLGEVDKAILAWKNTLKLAPKQAYANRMVEKLTGQSVDPKVRLALASSLLNQRLYVQASAELATLIRYKRLTDEQRQQLLLLEAELSLGMNQPHETLHKLEELEIRYPENTILLSTQLLFAQAQIALGGDSLAKGLITLEQLSKNEDDVTLAARAELELLAFQFQQEKVEIATVIAWLDQHAKHPDRPRAHEVLTHAITQLLNKANQAPVTKKQTALTESENQALAIAGKVYPTILVSQQADTLTAVLLKHFQQRYKAGEELAIANSAYQQIAKLDLPPTSSRAVKGAQVALNTQIATAEYQRIAAKLQQSIDDSAALTAWIKANPDHASLASARQALLNFYLASTLRQKKVTSTDPLSVSDTKAIAVAADIYAATEKTSESMQLTVLLNEHLKNRYTASGAFDASLAGYLKLLKIDLSTNSKSLLLGGLADVQSKIAMRQLSGDANEQRIQSGPLPKTLKDVLATYGQINQLTPSSPSFEKQAALGQQVAALSKQIAWALQPKAAKPTQDWAIEILLPVIADGSQAKAVQVADTTIAAIVTELSALTHPSADGLAVAAQAKRLAVLDKTSGGWTTAMLRRADLLNADAVKLFQRNISERNPDANNQLSKPHQEMIVTLKTLVTAHPSQSATVVSKLQTAMTLPLTARHYEVVKSAFTSIQPALPPKAQFTLELAQLQLLISQVTDRDTIARHRGFAIKPELDALIKQALTGAYELQRNLESDDPKIKEARSLLNMVTSYYRTLEMYAVVDAAIKVKAEKAVPHADKYAQFLLAGLKYDLALREQARLLKKFRAQESISFTPAFATAESAYQKFISDYPSDPFTMIAVEQLFALGRIFENKKREDIAAATYTRLEKFAAKIDILNQVSAGQTTTAERAALASAVATQQYAFRTLALHLDSLPKDSSTPTEISAEYAQAIAAYRAIIVKYPDGPLVKPAINRTLSIGLEYANHDAWDVADKIYASVLDQELPLESPEQIEFARALCQLGKVMPVHAKQLLTTMVYGSIDRSDQSGPVMLAISGLNKTLDRLREEADYDEIEEDFKKVADARDGLLASDLGSSRRGGGFGGGGGIGGGGGFGAPGGSGGFRGPAPVNQSAAAAAPADPAKKPAPAQTAAAKISLAAELEDFAEFALPELTATELARKTREAQMLAAVQQQRGVQATQIAQLRDAAIQFRFATKQSEGQQRVQAQFVSTLLSEAELLRQQKVLDEAYALLQALRTRYPETATAIQARSEILFILGHWRGLTKWQRAAKLAERFLQDNPTDLELPNIRQEIARDYLAWAAQGVAEKGSKQKLLDEVNRRYELARLELGKIVIEFPDNDALRNQAQWDVANSFLTQARVIATLSPTLARGQYVRSANELMQVAKQFHDHPQIGEVPQMLWNISQELITRKYYDEAISVWNLLANNYPIQPLGQQAALQIAQTYQTQNKPLKAVEAYVELNYSHDGNEAAMQTAIYNLAVQLKGQKRWVEALHSLETFVDSFPQHANAGQALTMIGQIHQQNEIWEDAIASYDRVILEYPSGVWVKEARWSIAECTINLSRWRDAIKNYDTFAKSYKGDPQAAQAIARIEILKDLDRYQRVVDEEGQRKSFDAQYQIGEIVRSKLANQVKAIIEFRKVATNWPQSHLADDALYQVGVTYLALGETELAREALLIAAEKYPTSPLADDALFKIGQSYQQEATKYATVTRDTSVAEANDDAQRQAYQLSQDNRKSSRFRGLAEISKLKEQGKFEKADELVARNAVSNKSFDFANAQGYAQWAGQKAQTLTAQQLADRQDKVNASLRDAVAAFQKAALMVTGDKADDALLQMAQIYDTQLKDADAAMETWQEIVKQFSGTSVAEDASWKIAEYHERHAQHLQAIEAYTKFLRNYRTSPKAGEAQAAIAENYEHLGKWVDAMDAYSNYLTNFPKGPLISKAKEQINWIKTYRL